MSIGRCINCAAIRRRLTLSVSSVNCTSSTRSSAVDAEIVLPPLPRDHFRIAVALPAALAYQPVDRLEELARRAVVPLERGEQESPLRLFVVGLQAPGIELCLRVCQYGGQGTDGRILF